MDHPNTTDRSGAKRLRMFAGPNGSGKTSLVLKFAKEFSAGGLFYLHKFLNADHIFEDLHTGVGASLKFLPKTFSAEEIRGALIAGGRLSPDHPFLESMEIVGPRLTAPAIVCDGYVAAAVADFLREQLFAAGESFSF